MLNNLMNPLRFVLVLIILFSTASRGLVHAANIVIRPKIPVYLHPDEAPEVHRAVEDLLRDLNTVFGQPSPLVKSIPTSGPVIVVATGNRVEDQHAEVSDWEAHQVYVNKNQIVLNGADNRGTIYAVYTLSELLGVKPLWFWASEKPTRIESFSLAADFSKVVESPDIKYRAWLPNDTDFIGPWQSRSETNYEAFFEAMLRLKLNTIEGSIADDKSFEKPYKLGRQAAEAKRRGIVTTGHHMQIFGSNYSNWENYWRQVRNQEPPALTIANRQALSEWWGFHIDLAMRNDVEVIWLIGFRGNRDIPFWEFFPDAPSDAKSRADIISEMVQLQINLLKEKTGDHNPLMRLTLYNEMTTLVADKLLKIPNEPSLIRNFVAARRDHFPAADIYNHEFSEGEPTGYYMNFQFTSTGSHLAAAEGPRKMEQNYRIVDSLSGGQLLFSVVNAGNLREHVLELSANANMLWNFEKFGEPTFFKEFSQTYYGSEWSSAIAELYKDYYNAFWQQKKADLPGFERQYLFQDMRYGRAAEMLLTDLENGVIRENPLENHPLDNPDKGSVGYFRVIPADNEVENQLEAMLKGTSASIKKLEKITEKADKIYANSKLEGKTLFDDNLRGQAYILLHLNRMLNTLSSAYKAHSNVAKYKVFLEQSLDEMRLVQQRLKQSEHGVFEGWYAQEQKFGVKKIIKRMENLLETVK